jgi:EAL domain-containing protein (putative c-di-GMP-specific phosphodiesterase class I)
MVFSQVCSNFRALAMSQSSLWSNFSCPFYPNESMAQLLKEYLERSGTAPLTIVLKIEIAPG